MQGGAGSSISERDKGPAAPLSFSFDHYREVYAVIPYPFLVPVPSETPADRNKLDDATAAIRALRDDVADLQRRLEKQAVLVRALFALLSAKLGLTDMEWRTLQENCAPWAC